MEPEAPKPRCGFPTKSGAPCKNLVDRAGTPCRLHARQVLLDRILSGRGASGATPADARLDPAGERGDD
jgi:hypothetical protein